MWGTGLGRTVSPMLSCPLTNAVHSALVMAAGLAGTKVGMLTMAAILVDWLGAVSEMSVGMVSADDQVRSWASSRCLGLTGGGWLGKGVEDPGLVFATPTEGDPIEF